MFAIFRGPGEPVRNGPIALRDNAFPFGNKSLWEVLHIESGR
jgi:hypothetical protein